MTRRLGRISVGVATGLVAGAVGIISGVSAPAATTAPGSGLRGQVLYGPTCPVQRAGTICERPYQATLVVSRPGVRGTVSRVRTPADGRFVVSLRAGRYLVKVTGPTAFPRSWSQKVSVTAHHYTSLTIHIDSGIR